MRKPIPKPQVSLVEAGIDLPALKKGMLILVVNERAVGVLPVGVASPPRPKPKAQTKKREALMKKVRQARGAKARAKARTKPKASWRTKPRAKPIQVGEFKLNAGQKTIFDLIAQAKSPLSRIDIKRESGFASPSPRIAELKRMGAIKNVDGTTGAGTRYTLTPKAASFAAGSGG